MKLTNCAALSITGIYKITNLITKHVYIGQSKNISTRIKLHLVSSINKSRSDFMTPLHAAIRKYGVDAFDVTVLEQCQTVELNTKEEYWIAQYDSFHNGYNQTAGGNQSIRLIKLTEDTVKQIQMDLASNTKTNGELAKKYGVSKTLIQRINTGRVWHNDDVSYPIRQIANIHKYHFDGFVINQYDKKTNKLLNTFNSISAAAKYLGDEKKAAGISKCCNGLLHSAYGFTWTKVETTVEDWQKNIV